MMDYVKKRTGEIVPFDKNKIVNAINNAFIDVDGQLYETDTSTDIANEIADIIHKKELSNDSYVATVELIQDLVED